MAKVKYDGEGSAEQAGLDPKRKSNTWIWDSSVPGGKRDIYYGDELEVDLEDGSELARIVSGHVQRGVARVIVD